MNSKIKEMLSKFYTEMGTFPMEKPADRSVPKASSVFPSLFNCPELQPIKQGNSCPELGSACQSNWMSR